MICELRCPRCGRTPIFRLYPVGRFFGWKLHWRRSHCGSLGCTLFKYIGMQKAFKMVEVDAIK